MRVGVIILAVLTMAGGCTRTQKALQPSATADYHRADLRYDESGHEPALAIQPPATLDNPRLNLARAGRERSVFMGFESSETTFSWVRMDDRQTEDVRNDRLERRAVSETVKTTFR